MQEQIIKKKYEVQQGFSLVELLVSVGIFAVVMVISVNTLLVLINANAKVQGEYAVISNVSFAIDSITRNIRTGLDHYCTASISDGATLPSSAGDCTDGSVVVFTDGETGDRTAYRLSGTSIEQKIEDGSWLRVTSSNVVVTDFVFTVSGAAGGDTQQPVVIFLLQGEVDDGSGGSTAFSLQSTVTARILNY